MAEGDGAAAISLPTDALIEILSRTPFKSVCRFRCVSREWKTLISDPAFVSQLGPLLVTSYSGENRYTDSCMKVMDMEGNVVREIKGLGAFNFVSSLDHLACIMCSDNLPRVVDLATRKVLTAFGKPAGNIRKYVIRLGRAAVSGSYYKAVRIVKLRRAYGVQPPQTCEVLTLGGHGANWRSAQPPPDFVRLLDFGVDWASATVDGVVHFLSSSRSLARDSVLCFDLESEEWRKTIQGPLNNDSELGINIRITEFKKSLCMIHMPVYRTCDIWLLIDPGNSIWVKAYSISGIWSNEPVQPLRVMPDGVKLLFYSPSMVRVYDSRSGTCTTVTNIPKNTFNIIGLCRLQLGHFVAPSKTNARCR